MIGMRSTPQKIISKPGQFKPQKTKPLIWLPRIFNIEFFMPTAKHHPLSQELSQALINLYNCSFTPGDWLLDFSSWILKEYFHYVDESLLAEAIQQGLREVRRISNGTFANSTPVDHLERSLAYVIGKESWRKEIGWVVSKIKDNMSLAGVDPRIITSVASLSEKEKTSFLKFVNR